MNSNKLKLAVNLNNAPNPSQILDLKEKEVQMIFIIYVIAQELDIMIYSHNCN